MTPEEKKRWLDEMKLTVERLAAPSAAQRAYLTEFGTAPSADELALEFNDSYAVAKDWENALSPPQCAALDALDQQLEAMSGQEHAELWDAQALDAPEWNVVRQLARRALAALRDGTRVPIAKAS